jgi:hypothetical protein
MHATVQELGSLQAREGIRPRQIKLSGRIGTLSPLVIELWKNPEHQIPRKNYNLSNEG